MNMSLLIHAFLESKDPETSGLICGFLASVTFDDSCIPAALDSGNSEVQHCTTHRV